MNKSKIQTFPSGEAFKNDVGNDLKAQEPSETQAELKNQEENKEESQAVGTADVHPDEVKAETNQAETKSEEKSAPEEILKEPEIKTVKMVCDKSIHPDGTADVHPDEVENWKKYGWKVNK